MPQDKQALFTDSVIVTGTHYSMSTLMGQIIAQAPEYHLVHEPLNPKPTLGYNAIGAAHWYEYYAADRHAHLRDSLKGYMFGKGVIGQSLSRAARIRSKQDLLRVGKYALTNARFAATPRRAVFKDPFLAFSGRYLQQIDGLHVVLCLRHPCGFAESLKRRGKGFEFEDLADQPDLMAALPEQAGQIALFAREPQPVLDQAALLWKVVYGFAAQHYLGHARTVFVRQEDLAEDPRSEVARVFAAIGASHTPAVDAFLESTLKADSPVDFAQDGGSYVRRNAQETTQKWKSRLAREEIARVMEIVGETAGAYGYAVE